MGMVTVFPPPVTVKVALPGARATTLPFSHLAALPVTVQVKAALSALSFKWLETAAAVRAALLPGFSVRAVMAFPPERTCRESTFLTAWMTVDPLRPCPLAVTVMSPPLAGVVRTFSVRVPAVAESR